MSIDLDATTTPPPALSISLDVNADAPAGCGTWRTAVSSSSALPRFQELCDSFGVRPTYFVSHPASADEPTAAFLRRTALDGRCEVGALLDRASTPPLARGEAEGWTYGVTPTPDLFGAKLSLLTEFVRNSIGAEPVSFRARGFGMTGELLETLSRHMYLVDSSVEPHRSWAELDGPDHSHAPCDPYRPSASDAARPGELEIVEVPVSVAGRREAPRRFGRFLSRHRSSTAPNKPLVLDPSAVRGDVLQEIAHRLFAEGASLFHISMPSTALFPGASRRCRTGDDAKAIFDALRSLLVRLVRLYGAEGHTLAELVWTEHHCLLPKQSEKRTAQLCA